MTTDRGTTGYTLDGNDCIVSVFGAWDTFALENDGYRCTSGKVIGTHLFSHIHDNHSATAVRSLLDAARTSMKPVSIQYSCDSPNLARVAEMTMIADEDGTVIVAHHIISEDPIRTSPKTKTILDGGPLRTERPIVKRCTMCMRIDTPNGWRHMSDLEPDYTSDCRVFHAVCDDCIKHLRSGSSRAAV